MADTETLAKLRVLENKLWEYYAGDALDPDLNREDVQALTDTIASLLRQREPDAPTLEEISAAFRRWCPSLPSTYKCNPDGGFAAGYRAALSREKP